MPFVIDWAGVVAGVAGVAVIYRVSTSQWFINQVIGAWAEWRTARALATRLRGQARIARGRIFACAGLSAEADCVVAVAHALFVIETKWRGCRVVAGTAEDNEWTATYRWGRPFRFPNPLKQAERQAGVIRAVLAARGMDCPVYRSVVILGAGSLPSVTGVFGDPGKLAVWVERFDAQLGARTSPASNATDALAVLIENSASGPLARIRHIWRLGHLRAAVRHAALLGALVLGFLLVGVSMYRGPFADAALDALEPVEDVSPAPPVAERPVTVGTDRCRDLNAALIVRADASPLTFVRTGAVGRLRTPDGVTFAGLVELAIIWSRDDRVEPLGFVDGPLLPDGLVPVSTEAVWLACSAAGTHPLTHAIEGRFVSDLAPSPTFHSASGFVGFSELSASSVAWAGPSRVFVDWIARSSP